VGKDHQLIRRLRTLTFVPLTPFCFIRAGSFVSFAALIAAPAIFLILLVAYDDSKQAEKAYALALDMASKYSAKLIGNWRTG